MSALVKIVDGLYNWKELSLWEFLKEGNIPYSWESFFTREDVQQELYNISLFLEDESSKKIIYPPINQVFRSLIPVNKIKVVLLGMDPYHNGSAVGLCFSVLPGNSINPSLRNIYKELERSGFQPNKNGDLTHLPSQGVVMLNTALTVRKGNADSHTSEWSSFSEKVIQHISMNTENVVWILMGAKAHAYENDIDVNKHFILKSSHPSPFSFMRSSRNIPAFLGSDIFKNTNNILKSKNEKPINW